MKRFISILLVLLMLVSASSLLISCKTKIDSGKEAAKLLLANERLDEKVLDKIDLGIDGTNVVNLSSGTPLDLSSTEKYMRLSDTLGVHYTWTEFKQHSHSMVEFTQFMKTIEGIVENAASSIERMKSNVGVTDKWVSSGIVSNEEHMLRVYENMDMLIIKQNSQNGLNVCLRYTNESAKNVYEIYSFYKYEDGDSSRMKLVYIPGERYEWASQHANGFNDYFIAENSRGYWVATRYGVQDTHATFFPLIIKDGLGYGGMVEAAAPIDERDMGRGLSIGAYSVFDPINNRELFRVYKYDDSAEVEVYFTAIKDGFVSVSTDNATDDLNDGIYQTGYLNKLVTLAGEYSATESEVLGQFAFSGGYIQHYYGDEFDYGNIKFKIKYEESKDLNDYILGFDDYLSSLGLTLYCDMETVKNSLYHGELYCQEFGTSFKWNGYKMSSFENAQKAREVFLNDTSTALGYYDEVKDFPQSDTKQKLSNDTDFADIDNIVMGESSYANGVITVSGVGISITDTALFENGLEYVLKLGLALCDEGGNPISVNTVSLKGDNESAISYTGGDIMLNASGNYQVPKNLVEGNYALVIYASDKDGIRTSKMEKLAFVSIEEGKLDSSAMDIEISSINNNLHATYTIKNTRYIDMTATKDTYSYNEIRRIVMQEILAYGYPDSSAVLEYENGDDVDKNASLGKGTYRMIAYLPTSDGLAQSYVYLTIK
jgi:hypothetical protein